MALPPSRGECVRVPNQISEARQESVAVVVVIVHTYIHTFIAAVPAGQNSPAHFQEREQRKGVRGKGEREGEDRHKTLGENHEIRANTVKQRTEKKKEKKIQIEE